MTCPTCNSTEIQERAKRNAFYPIGLVAIIGLPFALLHQVSSPSNCHCKGCGLDFACRTKIARVARVFLIVFAVFFGLLIAIGAIVFILERSSWP